MKTYKDIYSLPLRLDLSCSWVWDDNENFVFQFEIENENEQKKIVDVINGDGLLGYDGVFKHSSGLIFYEEHRYTPDDEPKEVILIRGWGGLTSPVCHNLSNEEAANVQDTFAEFIVEQLNNKT